MNCQDSQKLLHGYADGELDLIKNLEVQEHLEQCPECAHAHQVLHALRATINAEAPYYAAPPGLRERIQSAQQSAGKARTASRPFRRSWPAIAASLLIAALAGWGVGRFFPVRSADVTLTEQLLASHVRSQLLPNHRLDVESSDRHTVKPWFEGKLDFSPPVRELTGQGFPLIGGRLDYLNQRPVAALVYQRHKHFINLFIWPERPGTEAATESLASQGYRLIHWTQSGMTYWAVSDLNESELNEFVRLLQEQAP